ncbi:hypothetical protein BIWAKO_05085 [Bosea sp. BIWAKO-01]|nr:hypothetical protein BIWAKO_05085 [Bosea sp. BIWAKO-01]
MSIAGGIGGVVSDWSAEAALEAASRIAAMPRSDGSLEL